MGIRVASVAVKSHAVDDESFHRANELQRTFCGRYRGRGDGDQLVESEEGLGVVNEDILYGRRQRIAWNVPSSAN